MENGHETVGILDEGYLVWEERATQPNQVPIDAMLTLLWVACTPTEAEISVYAKVEDNDVIIDWDAVL